MNCSEVAERLCAYADGEVPRSFREAIDTHLEGCPRCRSEADRLVSNLEFMKTSMAILAAGDGDDASFLDVLKPKTRAEVAAAEREITGEVPSHRLRNAIVALAVLAAAIAVWFVFFAGDPDEEEIEEPANGRSSKATTRPDPTRSTPPRTGPTRRDPTRPPRGSPRPVPARPRQGVSLDDLPMTLARALRKTNAATAVPRIVQAASNGLKTAEQVAKVRGLVARGGSPEATGFILIILGSGPGPESYRPMLLTRLRADPAAQLRAAAAVALCRSGKRNRRVRYLEKFTVPVANPTPTVTSALLGALTTESEAAVRGLLVDLVGPASRKDGKVAASLMQTLTQSGDVATAKRIIVALSGTRHPAVAGELLRWLESGSVPGKLLGHAVGLLRTMDAKKAAQAAGSLLRTTQGLDERSALLGSLAGSTDDATLSLLMEILGRDPEASLRRQAVEHLSAAPFEKVRAALEAAEQGDSDPEVRRVAADVLAAKRKREKARPDPGEAGGR